MTRFTLVIDQAGRAVLTTPEVLTVDQVVAVKAQFAAWSAAQPPEALIVGECDVVRVTDVELLLEPEAR